MIFSYSFLLLFPRIYLVIAPVVSTSDIVELGRLLYQDFYGLGTVERIIISLFVNVDGL